MIRENEIFISVIRDPVIFQFVNRAKDPPVRPSKEQANVSLYHGSCLYLILRPKGFKILL